MYKSLILSVFLALPAIAQAPSADPAAAKPTFQLENGVLLVPGAIVFETGKDALKPESEAGLAHVEAFLREKESISLLRIEGHTDSEGDDQANQALSEKRAVAIARWLVSKGVDCKRVIPVGFGESKPIADNATPEGRAQNRRTVFAMAALRGRPIGGMPVDGSGKVAGDPCL